jgi:L-iditol 2-dehydrogenase
MRAIVYEGKGQVTLKEVPIPKLEDGEVLLEIEACGVCGVDLRIFKSGDPKIQPPRILGHEFCGRVVESRSSEPGSPKKGDRVLMYIVLPCGRCVYCQRGRSNLCDGRTTMSYHYDGGLAQYMKVPAAAVRQGQLFKVSQDMPASQLALAEPLGCVVNAHGRLNIGLKDTVAVIGAGPIGVMHGVLARLEGAQKVFLMDTSESRLKITESFGFDSYVKVSGTEHIEKVRALTEGRGPSVVIVACSAAAAQADALELVAKGGRVNFFGGLPKDKPSALLNTNFLHYKEIEISGSFSEKLSDFQAAQALIQTGRFPVEKLVTHELPLSQMHEAYRLMESGESLKVAMRPQL